MTPLWSSSLRKVVTRLLKHKVVKLKGRDGNEVHMTRALMKMQSGSEEDMVCIGRDGETRGEPPASPLAGHSRPPEMTAAKKR